MKFDLPRKRKKSAKKIIGSVNYLGMKILNELLFEENGTKPKYPVYDQLTFKVKFFL